VDHHLLPSISLIIPTYQEAPNVRSLLAAVAEVRRRCALTLELLVMDDDSRDGTREAVRDAGLPWVRLVVRTANRGLSAAVIDGMRLATNDVIVVMDADLSHPPEVIPELVAAVADGADFAIGSRYAPGGRTDPDWGLFRRANSRFATWLARPFTPARDPMSGFFAISRDRFLACADRLNPVGYKIGLELIVKGRCERIAEVPIRFRQRHQGRSKLTVREQLRYLQHLRRLALFVHPGWASLVQFAAVGTSGTVVNLGVVQLFSVAGVPDRVAIASGIVVSVLNNFLLNRRFTFSYARNENWLPQLTGFVGASSAGMVVSYATSVALRIRVDLPLLLAVCLGIVAGTGLNFALNRFLIFRAPRARRKSAEAPLSSR